MDTVADPTSRHINAAPDVPERLRMIRENYEESRNVGLQNNLNMTIQNKGEENTESSLSFTSPACNSSMRETEHMLLASSCGMIDANAEQSSDILSCASYNEELFLQTALGDAISAQSEPLASKEALDVPNSPFMTVKKYRTLTQQARTKKRPTLPMIPLRLLEEGDDSDEADATMITSTPEEKKQNHIELLLLEAHKQRVQLAQCNKAVVFCKSTREFSASEEYVEAERGLLLASNRCQTIVHELEHPRLENICRNSNELGCVTITGITLSLKPLEDPEETSLWFVCLAEQGINVLATRPLLQYKEEKLVFTDKLEFTNLRRNFIIMLEVYCMRFRKTSLPHEEKFHLNHNEQCSSTCMGNLKLHRRQSSSLSGHIRTSSLRTPSFKPIGGLHLEITHLTKRKKQRLIRVPLSSPLKGEIELNYCSSLELKIRHCGFLTMMQELGVWHRHWCCLYGHVVSYWNYPQDQIDKEALGHIDLRKVLSKSVAPADRTLCARPRTLLLETRDVRHLWHVDTACELKEWCAKLNEVLTAIRIWNVT